MRKTSIQISAVAKAVAKEKLAQLISAWPCIRDLNLPPSKKKRVPFVLVKKITMPPLVLFIILMMYTVVGMKTKIKALYHNFSQHFCCI